MTLTLEIWKLFSEAIKTVPDCPDWLFKQASLEFNLVLQLRVVDHVPEGEWAQPVFEQKIVTPDYLEFLRDQIKLSPRGPEWSAILKLRLAALEPLVGKQILTAMFYCKPHSAMLRMNPDTRKIIHMEVA